MSDCHCHNLCGKTNLGEFRDLNGVELDNIIEKNLKNLSLTVQQEATKSCFHNKRFR